VRVNWSLAEQIERDRVLYINCCKGCHSAGGLGTCPKWCEEQGDSTHYIGSRRCPRERDYA
jgi:hypothetical protein